MKQNLQDVSQKFIEHVNHPTRKHRVDVRNTRDWFKNALRTSAGAGNPKGSRLTPSKELRAYIEQELQKWSVSLKNECLGHSRYEAITLSSMRNTLLTAGTIDPGCWMTFGRIQKIYNIWFKYGAALYFSEYDTPFRVANPWFENVIRYAHVPIDRIVLTYLDKLEADDFSHLTRTGNTLMSWKREMSEFSYLGLQDALRALAEKKGYACALHLEMAEIW